MSRTAYITLSIGALGLLVMLALNQPDYTETTASAPHPTQSSKPAKPPVQASSPSSIQNRDDELTARIEPAVDLKALGIDPTRFNGMTSDPAVIRIWATYKPLPIGDVKQAGSGGMVLSLEDGRHFNAAHIGKKRSQSADGIVALDAITKPGGAPIKTIDGTEGGVTTTEDPSEVWIIDAGGKAERLSPDHVHAVSPEISPDGRYIAFTGQYLVGGDLHPELLMIKDRSTGELSSYAERKYGADYQIAPLDWVEGGKVLRVIEDWGETGGHMKLKQVRVQ